MFATSNQTASSERGTLLRPAEPCGCAGREDNAGDERPHARASNASLRPRQQPRRHPAGDREHVARVRRTRRAASRRELVDVVRSCRHPADDPDVARAPGHLRPRRPGAERSARAGRSATGTAPLSGKLSRPGASLRGDQRALRPAGPRQPEDLHGHVHEQHAGRCDVHVTPGQDLRLDGAPRRVPIPAASAPALRPRRRTFPCSRGSRSRWSRRYGPTCTSRWRSRPSCRRSGRWPRRVPPASP